MNLKNRCLANIIENQSFQVASKEEKLALQSKKTIIELRIIFSLKRRNNDCITHQS